SNPGDLTTDRSEERRVRQSNEINFSPVSQNTTSYTWTSMLSAGTTYFWEVHALGSTGGGTWSSQNSFTTVAANLAPPTLNNPLNNATGVGTQPTFSWSQVSGNLGYRIIVSSNPGDLTTD